jgi:serine/threonine protein kinase
MLVARFPEFDHQPRDHLVLKLPPALWQDKTQAARDLLQRLMCYEPTQRMTAAEALRHEWLGEYRWSDIETAAPVAEGLVQLSDYLPSAGGGEAMRKVHSVLSEKQSCDESIGGHSTSSSDSQYFNSTVSLRPPQLFPHLQHTPFPSQLMTATTPLPGYDGESQTGGYPSMLQLPLLLLLQLQRSFPSSALPPTRPHVSVKEHLGVLHSSRERLFREP